MKVTKKQLCIMDQPYAIMLVQWRGVEYCMAASEANNGEIVLINVETGRVQKVVGLEGGIMSIIPDNEGTFFAIERFYPVFKSEKARIARFSLKDSDGDEIQATVERVVDLPFVHRILPFGEGENRVIVAGTLCTTKAFEQDWSSSGYLYTVPPKTESKAQRISASIHKHHGMWAYAKNNSILVSGEEGLFELSEEDGRRKLELWLDQEVSDMCLYDLDGDGEDELITIQKFHGDNLCFYRRTAQGWNMIWREDVNFCHAIWAGKIQETSCVVACNRGGDKDTLLYTVKAGQKGSFELERSVIDVGTGTANITVKEMDDKIIMYGANHGNGEIASYILQI